MRFDLTWENFKAIHAHKGLAKSRVQCVCANGHHDAAFSDGPFVFSVHLVDGTPEAAEFEADWMPHINGPAT